MQCSLQQTNQHNVAAQDSKSAEISVVNDSVNASASGQLHTEIGIEKSSGNLSIDSDGLAEISDIPTDEEDLLLQSDDEVPGLAQPIGQNTAPNIASVDRGKNINKYFLF